jgi:phosphoglucosamine mutase
MTAEVAMRLGQAVAHHFRHDHRRTRILVGKDTRLSGYFFENALAAGITSMGADVMFVGPLPTPGIAFLTTDMRADAGIVISASHNPYQDNGIKIFAADGFKLPDEEELEIERLILTTSPKNGLDSDDGEDPLAALLDPMRIGRARRYEDSRGRYQVHVKTTFPKHLSLDGMKIVVDCANGAAYRVAPAALEELGADLVVLGATPNGTNINANCGSLHPRFAAAEVLQSGADLGITFDGDADRLILVDEKGQLIDGDTIMALCGIEMKRQGLLDGDTVVATVMSNLGLEVALRQQGIQLDRTQVGDRYVVAHMRKHGYKLGGEQSGHLIFLEHASTGDGLLAALQVLAIMQRTGKPLSELCKVMEHYPQTLVNVPVKEKRPLDQLKVVQEVIERITAALGDDGRVLVRYSGTENKVRVMVEGTDIVMTQSYADEIADAMRSTIGA